MTKGTTSEPGRLFLTPACSRTRCTLILSTWYVSPALVVPALCHHFNHPMQPVVHAIKESKLKADSAKDMIEPEANDEDVFSEEADQDDDREDM